MLVSFSPQIFLKHFSFQEELSQIRLKMCNGLHVEHTLFLSGFNELQVYRKVIPESQVDCVVNMHIKNCKFLPSNII